MATCEICGQQTETINTIKITGSETKACNSCKHLGKEVNTTQTNRNYTFNKRINQNQITLELIPNYSSILNKALAKKGLNLKQLARAINIRDSTLNKYFSGKMKPDNQIARKLENYFDIKILEQTEENETQEDYFTENKNEEENTNQTMSLGDLLEEQLRKKNQ